MRPQTMAYMLIDAWVSPPFFPSGKFFHVHRFPCSFPAFVFAFLFDLVFGLDRKFGFPCI